MERLLKISAALMHPTSSKHVSETGTLEVRRLTPPRLGDENLHKKVQGYRPMRDGTPNLSIEKIDDKVIVHNYGHGGSGWTLGPGSANYVLDMLENHATDLKKDTPFTIVGGGAIGLFTAYMMLERGYKNITIVAEKWDDLTSHVAGGLLAPVSLRNDPEAAKVIAKIGVDAYNFYKDVAARKNPVLKDGADMIPAYFLHREDSGLEPYVGKVMRPAKNVIVDFGNGTRRELVVYDDGIFMHTQRMMAYLRDHLNGKVKFVTKKIASFKEINDTYIINCTGLGSQELMKDTKLIPVQGHLMVLKDQNPQDIQYQFLIHFDSHLVNKHGQKTTRSLYFFPKQEYGAAKNNVGLIGGTFVEGATPDTPNEEEFGLMWKGAKDFFGI